jgi:hypothetical protein
MEVDQLRQEKHAGIESPTMEVNHFNRFTQHQQKEVEAVGSQRAKSEQTRYTIRKREATPGSPRPSGFVQRPTYANRIWHL